jgi:hypothetical protein
VTTLLKAKQFNKQELASLYKECWKIELDFLAIKTHMGMEMFPGRDSGTLRGFLKLLLPITIIFTPPWFYTLIPYPYLPSRD